MAIYDLKGSRHARKVLKKADDDQNLKKKTLKDLDFE